jgi:tetratricopeptide (TPR) repeat protein
VQEIRRWAARGLRALEVTDAATATAREGDPERLAAILRAYGKTHDLEAMPTLVSYLNDARIQVRTSARAAVRDLGRNAIWKLRVAFQEVTGKSADARWNADKTLDELCLLFDRERIERAETALARGLSAHLAGDVLRMAEQFELALRIDPQLSRRAEMAPGYAALGEARLAADDLAAAESAYRRALRLGPAHESNPTWRAQLSFVQAERALGRGVVDLPGYQAAVALGREHEQAANAIDRLSGAWSEREERKRRVIAIVAIVFLCACGIGVLRLRRKAAPFAALAEPS